MKIKYIKDKRISSSDAEQSKYQLLVEQKHNTEQRNEENLKELRKTFERGKIEQESELETQYTNKIDDYKKKEKENTNKRFD